MSQTFYLFRHGETFASKDEIPYGDKQLTATILPESFPSIEKIGEFLKPIETKYHFSSEFLRCKQTVEIVTRVSGKEFTFDKRLNEYIDVSFADYKERIVSFLESVGEYDSIVICTHGAGLSAFKSLLTKGSFEEFDLPDYPKTGVLRIIKDGKVEDKSFR